MLGSAEAVHGACRRGRRPAAGVRRRGTAAARSVAATSALKPVGTLCRPGHAVAGREGVVVISDAFLSWVVRVGGGSRSRRAHSQMPWARMSRAPRSAAGALRRGEVVVGSPSSEAVNTAPSSLCSVTVTCSLLAGPRDGDLVVAVGAVERRDVHLLLGARPALLVGVDEVGVPVAVGVVHLDDDAGELAAAAVAPEHADRVEAVAERAGVGRHHDAAAVGLDAVERRGSARRSASASGRGRRGGRAPRSGRARRGRAGGRGRPARCATRG